MQVQRQAAPLRGAVVCAHPVSQGALAGSDRGRSARTPAARAVARRAEVTEVAAPRGFRRHGQGTSFRVGACISKFASRGRTTFSVRAAQRRGLPLQFARRGKPSSCAGASSGREASDSRGASQRPDEAPRGDPPLAAETFRSNCGRSVAARSGVRARLSRRPVRCVSFDPTAGGEPSPVPGPRRDAPKHLEERPTPRR